MALIRCPECGREISDKASACPGCGCPVKEFGQEEQQKAARELPPEERPEMMECVKCGRKIPTTIAECPFCNYVYGARNTKSGDINYAFKQKSPSTFQKGHKSVQKKRGFCGTIFWVFIILGVIGAFFGKNSSDKKGDSKDSSKTVVNQRENDTYNANDKNGTAPKGGEVKATPVAVENSTVLYYMDLYENYEQYENQYVTISAPLSYATDDIINVKGDINGVTGMIHIALLEPRTDLKEGDYVTVTGRIENKALGYLYMKDANISATGQEPAKIYEQQKQEYDARVAEREAGIKQEFVNSCQRYGYEELMRYPDTYKDKPIVNTLVVEQVMPGGFLSSEGYRCYEVGTENEVVLIDDRETMEPKFVEGDTITVYGTYYGTEKMTRLLTGEKISVPCIEFRYADFN